ncbi:helicase [Alloacidobacterium dinghuense]|uniref:Helicase n=1 Tax=Alloacidobacterium dinghuense TaxID=2763107 RepID=A0A7G8BE64_9BACT|nr:helicase-related protein [Alloacidobacterium dinghuense]QNI30834.1 helicase [Alloacidobacterium dinghuense]
MVNHIADRALLLDSLRRELVGPDPRGEELDCTQPVSFAALDKSYGPWRQKENGEEVLQRDPPTKRYGIGVLYPAQTLDQDDSGVDALLTQPAVVLPDALDPPQDDPLTAQARRDLEDIQHRTERSSAEPETEDLDLSSANSYRPSSVAVSFLASVPKGAQLIVEATGGRYQRFPVTIEEKERTWWLRSPVRLRAQFNRDDLLSIQKKLIQPTDVESTNLSDLDIRIEVYGRPSSISDARLFTVCLVNRSSASSIDERSLFQFHFKAHFESTGKQAEILPYPAVELEKPDDEEQSLALLYRETETFAIGHGCAADWSINATRTSALAITGECLPTFETPSVTPDIRRQDGSAIDVSMAALAGLIQGDDGLDALEDVVAAYEQWIDEREKGISLLDIKHRTPAERHMRECARCADRMRDGIDFLNSDPRAMRAFRLANEAILLQQLHSRRESRRLVYDTKGKRLTFSDPYVAQDTRIETAGRGKWRAFQIAFLLMTLRSTADGRASDRSTVELIWFPTGGGKTEAYLALSAFSILMRRLRNPADAGVEVIMRYTLRLLTAQQFQRAAGLLCALEYLRRQPTNEKDLGQVRFSIGIWLGGSSTPNSRQQARSALTALSQAQPYAENPFIITKCPWCAAEMGPVELEGKIPSAIPKVHGYERQGDTVVFKCSDRTCDFSSGLPIVVIDEDIYDMCPTLIIGTVDKFAMLAWRPEARAIFGLGSNGTRKSSPPGLIIQDELHLISGPLGSMVGLYEALIEELCTDRRNGSVPPKIVSSTATIRRYASQVRDLYGRETVALFPPPGLSASDSFFAQHARRPDGSLAPGRIYVGVHAPGLGSLQTAQVRAFTGLLQAPLALPDAARDPWWTILAFFNSLRELGTTLSLLQSDIPDYLKVIRNRTGAAPDLIRRLRNVKELTGRLPSEEIPLAISTLEAEYGGQRTPVDICLASNIIEVGVDIDRLSLMAVVGQPKTTSQYIQVTGRVGRRWWERPGVVVTIYVASKPRDRSHFEKFRSYHERLYAQVEPTSVTPYSRPALERALHAVMVAYVRQFGTEAAGRSPYPIPQGELAALRDLLVPRVTQIDPDERASFERLYDARTDEWRRWERNRYSGAPSDEEIPLLRPAGGYASPEHVRISWPTPQSMRAVDAECQVEITTLYLNDRGADNA